ncbi:MAG: uracil-DNA glycosylase [Proteobacteria bacterium]|nr:MAG: uracil-DNA glycosylase [Pseudomonadota bacterium]
MPGTIEQREQNIVCRKCGFYFVTHDSKQPYGCRAMGFKSRKNPARVVFESSGIPCRLFTPKDTSGTGSGSRYV